MTNEAVSQHSKKKKLVAGFLSALIPGAGQFLLRNSKNGSIWLGAYLVFLLISSVTHLWAHYYGLMISAWFPVTLAIVSAYKTAFPSRTPGNPSRWWVLLFIAMAWVPIQLTQIVWWSNGYRLYIVPSTSMQPTIWRGDRVVADMHFFRRHTINRRDVIIYKRDNIFLAKRVEAVPGDVIEGKDGTVFLNGKELDEGFEKPNDPVESFLANFGPVKVPPGEYFVLGDNRPVSLDSRAPNYGPIRQSEISGRALFVFNPLDHSHDKRLMRE